MKKENKKSGIAAGAVPIGVLWFLLPQLFTGFSSNIIVFQFMLVVVVVGIRLMKKTENPSLDDFTPFDWALVLPLFFNIGMFSLISDIPYIFKLFGVLAFVLLFFLIKHLLISSKET